MYTENREKVALNKGKIILRAYDKVLLFSKIRFIEKRHIISVSY